MIESEFKISIFHNVRQGMSRLHHIICGTRNFPVGPVTIIVLTKTSVFFCSVSRKSVDSHDNLQMRWESTHDVFNDYENILGLSSESYSPISIAEY